MFLMLKIALGVAIGIAVSDDMKRFVSHIKEVWNAAVEEGKREYEAKQQNRK